MFKTGLIHRETPAHVPMLSRLATLRFMPPPVSVDWHHAYPADGDPLGNDQFGCCLPVAEFQTIGMRRANAWKDTWRPNRTIVLARYSHLTGFDPVTGLPDDGTESDKAMTDWADNGIRLDSQNEDVIHWFSVQRRAIQQIKLAIAHFGPVEFSVNLPNALRDNPLQPWSLPTARAPGDWTPGSWGGHRTVIGKYDHDIFTTRTWGHDVIVTMDFLLTYGLAIDVGLSRQWFDSHGLSGSGLTWDTLMAEASALRA